MSSIFSMLLKMDWHHWKLRNISPGALLRLVELESLDVRLHIQCGKQYFMATAPFLPGHSQPSGLFWPIQGTQQDERMFYSIPQTSFCNGIYKSGLLSAVPKMECTAQEGREGKKKSAKQRRMTHMAKLFCLHPLSRHQNLQRIN